jgi:putative ABC transport system substrate-binding protein
VDVIVTSASFATLAAKRATTKIPIVMLSVNDPLGQGIVASLAHPGGNITGLAQDDSPEIAAKRVQLLKDAVPRTHRVAALLNPDLPWARSQWQQLELAAKSLNVTLQQVVARQASEFQKAFAAVADNRPDGLLVTNSELNFVNRQLIMDLSAKIRLPTIVSRRETVESGGLICYGNVRADSFRRAAIYVGKILNGAKPADLPIELPTKYELVINLKTARLLSLEVPRDLLLVADEVIE